MIIPLENFPKLRENELKGKKIVATCGWFDPIHPGHISCIMDSKKFGDILIVLINGDQMAITKKGKPFMPATDRADIVDCIKGVDYTAIYDHPTEYSMLGGLMIIKPDIFAKGGDRDKKDAEDPNSPLNKEITFIESYGGRVEFGVGKDKQWSSSDYLEDWYQFRKSQEVSNS
jgi:cytidyltransferase-like protein